jgi:hypothetical protein
MKLISSREIARGEELHLVDTVLKLLDQGASVSRRVIDRLNNQANALRLTQIKVLKRLEYATCKDCFNGLGHTI